MRTLAPIVSATVTTATPDLTLPLTSVMVKVTLFAPLLAQVNVNGEATIVAIPHASDEPLFTKSGVIVTFPVESNWAVIFLVITIGLTVSKIVTIEGAVAKLPEASVTVNVTLFTPKFEQVNDDGVAVNEDTPQLSLEPLLIEAPANVKVPLLPKYAVKFLAIAIGLIVSATVTVAVPVLIFPFTSVTVNVTVFAPLLAQVNVKGDAVIVLIPQASDDPLLICEAVIEAVPDEFNWTVIFCVITTGLTVSAIVTIAVPVLTFPFTSVTDNTTVFVPMFEHVNELGVTDNNEVLTPQLSVEPLLTWAGVIVATPVFESWTVMFLVVTTGLTVSITFTIAVPVLTFPLLSVTVNVTVLFPTLLQVNELGDTDIIEVFIPQASDEPLLIWAAVIEAVPIEDK